MDKLTKLSVGLYLTKAAFEWLWTNAANLEVKIKCFPSSISGINNGCQELALICPTMWDEAQIPVSGQRLIMQNRGLKFSILVLLNLQVFLETPPPSPGAADPDDL